MFHCHCLKVRQGTRVEAHSSVDRRAYVLRKMLDIVKDGFLALIRPDTNDVHPLSCIGRPVVLRPQM